MDIIALTIVGALVLGIVILIWSAFWLWWQSILSNAPVSLLQIIFMRFRKGESRGHRHHTDYRQESRY